MGIVMSSSAARLPAPGRPWLGLDGRLYIDTKTEPNRGDPHVCHDRKLSGRRSDPAVHVRGPRGGARGAAARIAATRFPDKETVEDQSQGTQLATIQALARYWATEHDWRKCEAKLNALPQFITEIDGLDIHFIHVRSKHESALPLIVTHGCPGPIIEQMKIIDPLTDPTAHGGTASDAFHLVIPSIPGYGYSGKPTTPGWDAPQIARAWGV